MNRLSTPPTNSKTAVLDRLRSRPIDAPPLPVVDASKLTQFDDPVAHFVEMLKLVGGEAHLIDQPAEAKLILESIDVFKDAKRVASLVSTQIKRRSVCRTEIFEQGLIRQASFLKRHHATSVGDLVAKVLLNNKCQLASSRSSHPSQNVPQELAQNQRIGPCKFRST
jgi:hypothetical protein